MNETATCPCGSGRALAACCGPYLEGAALPPTAEALMRSRYSAFATGNIDYLEETLMPGTRGDFDRAAVGEWSKSSEWTGLLIRSVEAGSESDTEGYVEFVAQFRQEGTDRVHHETGHFGKQDGRWYYVDGVMGTRPRTVVKIGRNDPCSCGSGKKYKKCCGMAA
ncbi:YchJ family protein [Parvibaculum sp.]|uniref:YchJ family protein n=1 Tax=Parvibaculum sp. TaxID=2024848 RepID=UPI00345DBC51